MLIGIVLDSQRTFHMMAFRSRLKSLGELRTFDQIRALFENNNYPII